jgi:para-aminobenzoate synthetase / 4-amino-4-deoxychorismate lyase
MINSILLRRNKQHVSMTVDNRVGSSIDGEWLSFTDPVEVISTSDIGDIVGLLADLESRVEQEKLFAAGFISYEASPAFDNALTASKKPSLPLLCFGLFKTVQSLDQPPVEEGDFQLGEWRQPDSKDYYVSQLAKIKKRIRAGDTYQVNYTFTRKAIYNGNPKILFSQFAKNAPYAAYLEMDDFVICSASPELFFTRTGSTLTTKPMKGTLPRGLTEDQDNLHRNKLKTSEKDRAENIMVVDMIRNDLGRIAQTGSVNVEKQLQLEKYPTLWQMTSTVTAKTDSSSAKTLSALFPCASITGAPKAETMKIIDGLETEARGIYTGSIGYIAPGGLAQFSVAIRTALLHLDSQQLDYGVGSGIVWDSDPVLEYQECLLKSRAIRNPTETRDFDLLETLLWEKGQGYYLMDYHLARLNSSAQYFDFSVDEVQVTQALDDLANDLSTQSDDNQRVRLTVGTTGQVHIETQPLEQSIEPIAPAKVRFGKIPIDSSSPFYYHKTTHRQMYEDQKQQQAECFDVLLWNENNEVTEFTIANFVLELDGSHYTPPISTGLLNGTYRQHLLDQGQLQERVIYKSELNEESKIFLINSVRKWAPVSLELD